MSRNPIDRDASRQLPSTRVVVAVVLHLFYLYSTNHPIICASFMHASLVQYQGV